MKTREIFRKFLKWLEKRHREHGAGAGDVSLLQMLAILGTVSAFNLIWLIPTVWLLYTEGGRSYAATYRILGMISRVLQ